MSSTKLNASFTFSYEGMASDRTYTIENIPSTIDPEDVSDAVNAINLNEGGVYAPLFETFISNEGGRLIKISAAKVVRVVEEVIYSG